MKINHLNLKPAVSVWLSLIERNWVAVYTMKADLRFSKRLVLAYIYSTHHS